MQVGAWLDVDGDGHITFQELMEAIKESFQANKVRQRQAVVACPLSLLVFVTNACYADVKTESTATTANNC